MHLTYTLTQQDVLAANRFVVEQYVRADSAFKVSRIGAAALFGFGGGCMLLSIARSTSFDVLLPMLIFGGFLFAITFFVYPWLTKNNMEQRLKENFKQGLLNELLAPQSLTLTPEHYVHTADGVETRTTWEAIKKIDQIPGYLLVFLPDDMHIIPHTAFADRRTYQQFLSTLKEYAHIA